MKDQDFILREKGSAGREIFDGLLAAQELAVAPLWQSASNQAILHGVRSGLGISILPYSLVQESLKKGEIAEFKIKGMALSRKYSVIYHKNKFFVPKRKDLGGNLQGGGVSGKLQNRIRALCQQLTQLPGVHHRDGPPSKGNNPFLFKIFQHPGNHFPGRTQIFSQPVHGWWKWCWSGT